MTKLFLIAIFVASLAAYGAYESRSMPEDRAEIAFLLEESRITGKASQKELDRMLLSLFSDETLAGDFASSFVDGVGHRPDALEWLEKLLAREGIEPDGVGRDELIDAFRSYLVTVVSRQLAFRVGGSPSPSRADFWMYSPVAGRIHLYMASSGDTLLPLVSEASAKAFNASASRLNEIRRERWEKHVASFETLLASRVSFFSNRIEVLGEEAEVLRGRLVESIAQAEVDPEGVLSELGSWLDSEVYRDSGSFLPWVSRLRRSSGIPPEISTDLAALRANQILQELILGTDWLDSSVFGTRTLRESKTMLPIFFAPPIPAEQIAYSPSRRVEPMGRILAPRWAAPIGGGLVGLGLAFAIIALIEGITSWRREEASK